MAASNADLAILEVKLKNCQQSRKQEDDELTQVVEQALLQLRCQSTEIGLLRETLAALRAVNVELVTRMKGFQLMEARLSEHEQLERRVRACEMLEEIRSKEYEKLDIRVRDYEKLEIRVRDYEKLEIRVKEYEEMERRFQEYEKLESRVRDYEKLEIRVREYENMERKVHEYEKLESRSRRQHEELEAWRKESDHWEAKMRMWKDKAEKLEAEAKESASFWKARVRELKREVEYLEKKIQEAAPSEMRIKNLKKDLEEMTQQRNRYSQQLRNTQEHRGKLQQQMMEARDMSLQVLRGCMAELNQVPAVGVTQLVSAINALIQPVVAQEGEDLVMTEQRNGLRQQLRNTQEHKARLQQELMEAGDSAMKALRDCMGALSKVQAEGVPQLLSNIKKHIQPVVEQEDEDLVEVNPEPKLGESMKLLVKTIITLLAATTKA
ncbi:unnamed protein product [Closterium sp. Yama58-4]|nr:unnamed protein product [Closterium sp. Yama58-4]